MYFFDKSFIREPKQTELETYGTTHIQQRNTSMGRRLDDY